MARNTHIVKKAQDQLPYITAIIKETFRWTLPVPIGASHRLMEDDVYKGMLIPAGTMLLESLWLVHPFRLKPDDF